jgi:hypothetical protein
MDYRAILEKMVVEGADYETIRAVAKSKGLEGAELKQVMRDIDHQLLQRDEIAAEKGGGLEWILVGVALLAIGLVLYSFDSKILDPRFEYLIWGAWGGGALMVLKGRQQYR